MTEKSLQHKLLFILVFALVAIFVLILTSPGISKSSNKLPKKNNPSLQLSNTESILAKGGRKTLRIYSEPVRYKENGKWANIDTKLKKQGQKIIPKQVPYQLKLDSFSAKTASMSFQKSTVKLELVSATKSKAQIKENIALYRNAYRHTDVERIARSTGFKQNYILKAKGHPNIFKEKIRTSLKVKLDKKKEIYYLKSGKKIFHTPKPIFYDAAGKLGIARYRLKGKVLSLILPSLKSYKYPIVLDPTIDVYPASVDDDFDVQNQGGTYSINANQTTMQVKKTASNYEGRMYIKFPTSSIPANTPSAVFYLYNNYSGQGGSAGPTVYHSDAFSAGSPFLIWTTVGVSTNLGQIQNPSQASGYNSLDVTTDVIAQKSAGTAYFQLRAPDISSNIYTYQSADSANRPYLQVEQSPPPTYTPTGVASSSPGENSMLVSWTPGDDDDINGYNVYAGSHQTSETEVGTVSGKTSSSTTASGLSANTSYQFHVHAYNDGGDGPASDLSTAKYTLIEAPELTQSDLTPSATGMTVDLSSHTLTNLTTLLSGVTYENVTNTESLFSQLNSWTTSVALSSNTEYGFRITTQNAEAVANSASATFYRHTLANVPTISSLTSPSSTSLNLSFGANGNGSEVTYSIKKTNGTTQYVQADGTLGASEVKQSFAAWNSGSVSITGLSAGARYDIQVISYNSDTPADPNPCTASTKYTLPAAPSAPTLSALSNSSLGLVIDTNGNDSSVVYRIKETTLNQYVQADGTLGVDDTVWQSYATWGGASGQTISSLTANTQYTFMVTAKNSDFETADGSTAQRWTLPNTPGITSLSSISSSSLRLTIDQNDNTSPAGITYEIKKVDEDKYVQADGTLGTSAVARTYDDWGGAGGQLISGLGTNTQYSFYVRALSLDSDRTSYGDSNAKYTQASVPDAPTVSGDYDETYGYHIDITVNPATNPAGTQYAVSTDGTNYVQADGTLSSTAYWTTSSSLTYSSGVAANTLYSIQVKAKNGDGDNTSFSTAGTDTTPPAAPTGLSYSDLTYNSARATWGASDAATQYQTSFGFDTAATNIGIDIATANTYIDKTDLRSGTTYYFKVRATNTNGTGAYSSVGNFTVLGPTSPAEASISIYRTNLSPITLGSYINDSSIKVKISSMSSVYGDAATHRLTPQIEIKEAGLSFDGSASSGSPVSFNTGSPVDGWVDISGLASGKSYRLRARVKDEDLIPGGVESYWTDYNSGQSVFTVDTTAPSVSFASPTASGYYRGTISVSANIADNLAVVGTSYYCNSLSNHIHSIGQAPWVFGYNSAGINGAMTMYAVATDIAGNTASGQVAFNVDNYRPVTSAPKRAAVRRGKIAKLYYKITDPYSGGRVRAKIKLVKKVKKKYRYRGRIRYKYVWKVFKWINLGIKKPGILQYYRYRVRLAKGKYKFSVYATDIVGNPQRNVATNWLVVK
ncbi:MAG: fibronectin type III domain-containing protein [Actinobacteria bacterium]|nr:MAG: fibronectin type III domain-containing protein [Actinomycetota bacterium]